MMKTIAWALLIGLFSSCGDMVEEIHLNEDGTGVYDLHSDMMKGVIEMTKMMALPMSDQEFTEAQLDSLDEAMVAYAWKDFPDRVDSTIDLRSEMPDSLLGDPDVERILASTEMYMRGTKESGVMNIGMEHRFQDLASLTTFFDDLDQVKKQSKKEKGNSNPFSGSVCEYSMSEKSFKRAVTSREEWSESDIKAAKAMFAEATYRTIIHLPRDVKKVKGNGLVNQEKRVVEFEYAFMDIVNGKEDGAFEIFFK